MEGLQKLSEMFKWHLGGKGTSLYPTDHDQCNTKQEAAKIIVHFSSLMPVIVIGMSGVQFREYLGE